jgi:hypothetical protein
VHHRHALDIEALVRLVLKEYEYIGERRSKLLHTNTLSSSSATPAAPAAPKTANVSGVVVHSLNELPTQHLNKAVCASVVVDGTG